MASVSKKGTQIYFSFLSKVPANEARLQGILHISQKPHFSGSPVKEPSLKVPIMECLTGDAPPLEPSFIHQSKSLVYEPPPHTRFPSDGKLPPWREMPISRDFLNISCRVPSEEAPPKAPSMEPLKEKGSIPRAPFIQLSKSTVDKPSSRFPKWSPYGKRCPSPEPFLHILQGPQQGSRPFPSQSPHRKRERESDSTSRALFNHISKSLVDEPMPVCPSEPP